MRDTPAGRLLYIARPIQIRDAACLACHSTVDAAPKTLIDRYGPANGFGWKMNEIIGAQVVSVPTDVPTQRARAAFRSFMLSLAGVFVLVVIATVIYALISIWKALATPRPTAVEIGLPGAVAGASHA